MATDGYLSFEDDESENENGDASEATSIGSAWKILVVDDEAEVHKSTVFALSSLQILGKPLQFLHAYSSQDAVACLNHEADVAVILLDVVMETPDAGLQLVKVIRQDLGRSEVRIVLRTGQPGYAPEMDTIRDFDINDYRTKTDLTRNKLYITLTVAIRSFEQLQTLNLAHQRIQQELLERERAELRSLQALESSRMKSAFVANMSHEIRTPVNAIVGLTNLALLTPLDPKQQDFLSKIKGASLHLMGVINNILDFSKIAAGRMELEYAEFDLREVLDSVQSMNALNATTKKIELVCQVAPQVPSRLIGDALRLKQVMMNLVGNAIKFTDAGRVQVDAVMGSDLPDPTAERVWLRLQVRDSGVGLSPDQIEKVFQPFEQADSSITRRYGGTGLGLSISRQLVELMGGKLSVSSETGVGSTFSFEIELGVGQEGAVPALLELEANLGALHFNGVRVLLADDQPLNQQVASELLALRGVAVDLVDNGQMALDRLFESAVNTYDLVLMDIQMPVLDGISATKRIRLQEGFQAIPIIAMTAHVMSEAVAEFLSAGFNDHLGKPFHPDELYATIGRWVAAAKRVSASTEETPILQRPFVAESRDDAEIDWSGALERFNQDPDDYAYWLRNFIDERRNSGLEIGQQIAAGNFPAAVQTVHALKGVSGVLGLVRLQRACADLEVELKKEDTSASAEALSLLLADMIAKVERYLVDAQADE